MNQLGERIRETKVRYKTQYNIITWIQLHNFAAGRFGLIAWNCIQRHTTSLYSLNI